MWNRILQSITTLLSAGGGAVEQMCWDFCRERRRIWMNTKGKHTPLKGVLREWVKKDSASQTIPNQSIGHCLLIFFYLARGTKHLREALQQKASYPSVYQAFLQNKMKSNLLSSIFRSFYLWFWYMTHSLHSDCRFLFSPMDISRSTKFYELCCHKFRKKLCTGCIEQAHRNISRLPLSDSRMDFYSFFYLKTACLQN